MARFFSHFTSFACIAILSLCLSHFAFAQASKDDVSAGCDVDFYEQLNASATLKSTQEMEAAQTIITKPDSVLEYNCFDRRLNSLASSIAFQDDLSGDLKTLVGTPINTYLSNNFNHALDGGRSDTPSDPCGTMGYVWHTAKCHNFDIALFRDFTEMADSDPRIFPPKECPGKAERKDAIEAMVAAYQRPARKDGEGGTAEKIESYAVSAGACAKAIPTGLKASVTQEDGTAKEVDDVICPTAGCYYNGNACVRNANAASN